MTDAIWAALTDPFVEAAKPCEGPVLVTGAGGCIGAWVMAILTRAGIKTIGFDLHNDRRRPALIMGEAAASTLTWETGDIADKTRLAAVVAQHNPRAIIHLAGLQIPFCKADPVAGAQVNVVGTLNVFEAARSAGITRTLYTSSVASHGIPTDTSPYLATLYGVYKMANEESAKVYWQDWNLPSIGVRPNVVYGLARDQGVSSKFTLGMQAAVLGVPFDVSFSGPTSFLYAGEAAAAMIAAVSRDQTGANVFDLNGACHDVGAAVALLNERMGLNEPMGAKITHSGTSFPFPPDLSDAPLRAAVGDYPHIGVADGIDMTLKAFQALKAQSRLPDLPA